MKENAFQRELIRRLEKEGARVINFAPSMFMSTGIADIYVHHEHFRGFLELKVNRNVYSQIQSMFLRRMNSAVPYSAWGLRLDGQILQLEKVEEKGRGIIMAKWDWRLVKFPIATINMAIDRIITEQLERDADDS